MQEWLIPFIIGTVFGIALFSARENSIDSRTKQLFALILAFIFIFLGSFAGNLFANYVFCGG